MLLTVFVCYNLINGREKVVQIIKDILFIILGILMQIVLFMIVIPIIIIIKIIKHLSRFKERKEIL